MRAFVGLGPALLLLTAALASDNTRVYPAPDGSLRAVVRTGPTRESRVEIETAPSRVLLTRDETSGDGSHGFGVTHAAWTRDSQFFVASTTPSAGHQPWAHPIWVYSRARNQVFELGKMGATAVSDFGLKPPDVIRVKILDCEQSGGELRSRVLAMKLLQLVTEGHPPKAPCAVH